MLPDMKTFLASFGLWGVGFIVVLYYVQKVIDRRFEHLWAVKEAANKVRAEMHRQFTERQLAILQKVQHRISDSRNSIRLFTLSMTHDNAVSVVSKSHLMADVLYESQLLIAQPTYDAVHVFKRTVENAAAIVAPTLEKPTPGELSQELLQHLEQQYGEATRLIASEMDSLKRMIGVLQS